MHLSLSQKLLAMFLLVFVCAVGGLSAFMYQTSRDAMTLEFKIRGRELVKALASEARTFYVSQDIEGITTMLQSIGEAEGVLAILAYDGAGGLWLESSIIELGDSEIPLTNQEWIWQHDRTLQEGTNVSEFVHVVWPNPSPADHAGPPSGRPLGWMRILLDRGPIEARLTHLFRQNLALSAFTIFLGGVLFTVLLRQSLKVIPPLTAATQQVAAGTLTATVPVTTHDELGELAACFNRMTAQLHETTVSRHYLDLILNSMFDSLIVIDKTGTIHTVNHATCALLECSEADLIGQRLGVIFPPGEGPLKGERIDELLSKGVIGHTETAYLTKTNRRVPVMFSAAFMREADGMVQGIACVAMDITKRKEAEDRIALFHGLLQTIHSAQAHFIAASDPHTTFSELLESLLTLTNSEFGFIGERLVNADGRPFLKTHAISDIAWDEETRARFQTQSPNLEFSNLQTLFGEVLISAEPVISNDPANDPRGGGTPRGHPPLRAFLGLPFFSGNRLVGMIGLANRPGGYQEDTIDFLQPLLSTCGNLIEAYRNEQRRAQAETALRESVERFEMAVRGSRDGLWDAWAVPDDLFNLSNPVYFSPRFKELLGFSDQEFPDVIGSWAARLHPDDRDKAFDDLRAHLEEGRPYHSEYRMITKSGECRWFEGRGQAIWDDQGRPVRMSGSFSDITERKEAQAALEEAHEKLKILDQLRTQFFADISHELRTPLTVIRGEAEVTLRGPDKPLAEYKVALERIVQLTNEVNKLVNDLLFLARSETGTLPITFQACSLQEILKGSIHEAAVLAQKKRITITTRESADPLITRADIQRLRQLFLILLDNAIKYSDEETTIEVACTCTHGIAAITIRDRGRGIPEKDVPHVFERFYRVKRSGSSTPSGAGLGLAIAKWIVEAHQGEIALSSTVGSGTTVTIALPIQTEEGEHDHADPVY